MEVVTCPSVFKALKRVGALNVDSWTSAPGTNAQQLESLYSIAPVTLAAARAASV